MTIAQTAYDLLDRLFGYEETHELAYPLVCEGDKFYRDSIELTVDAIIETCPFVVTPPEWDVWGTTGAWCYIVAVDLAYTALAKKDRVARSYTDSAWVPLDYLVKVMLEQ